MAKKIYDIKPPKAPQKKESVAKELLKAQPKKRSKPKVEETVNLVTHKKRNMFIGGAVFVLVLAVYLFFALPRVTVDVWPKVDTLSFQQTITADKSADQIDQTKEVIPAKYFEALKTETQDFPATGNADNVGQATGTITVYNKYDPPAALTLKAGTHFVSDSGKWFVSLAKIVVPAAKKTGGKLTPGSVQVKIQAVEGGESYNIAPSNFSVPGLKGSAYYYAINAASTESMSGGFTGKVKKVTDDDLQNAKDTLSQKVSDDALSDLKKQISDEYVLLDNATFTNVTSASTEAKSGTVADGFKYSVTVKANALVFKKSDIDMFATDYIISQIPDGKALLDKSFKVDYTAKTIDVSGGKATIALNFSSSVYQAIDKNAVALSVMNKDADQISQTVASTLSNQVDKTDVNFWPFWVSKAPDSQKAVFVNLKFK